MEYLTKQDRDSLEAGTSHQDRTAEDSTTASLSQEETVVIKDR